jgi:hypothetical protein
MRGHPLICQLRTDFSLLNSHRYRFRRRLTPSPRATRAVPPLRPTSTTSIAPAASSRLLRSGIWMYKEAIEVASQSIIDAGAPSYARLPACAHGEPDARRHQYMLRYGGAEEVKGARRALGEAVELRESSRACFTS